MSAALPKPTMSSSARKKPKPKFLLDENVRSELAGALKIWGVGFLLARKGAGDAELRRLSKDRKLVLVTNDKDFLRCFQREIYGLILLRLPQTEVELLISKFKQMLSEYRQFSARRIVLEKTGWSASKLPEK